VDGKQAPGPVARFTGLPANTLLTQNLNVPENWLVEVVRSVYDLDNIKLIDINGPVHSEYELEYLLLEGRFHRFRCLRYYGSKTAGYCKKIEIFDSFLDYFCFFCLKLKKKRCRVSARRLSIYNFIRDF
jgi:hypothetical protein